MATNYKTRKQTINLLILYDLLNRVNDTIKNIIGRNVSSASAIEHAINQAYHMSDNAKKSLIRQQLKANHKDLWYS